MCISLRCGQTARDLVFGREFDAGDQFNAAGGGSGQSLCDAGGGVVVCEREALSFACFAARITSSGEASRPIRWSVHEDNMMRSMISSVLFPTDIRKSIEQMRKKVKENRHDFVS